MKLFEILLSSFFSFVEDTNEEHVCIRKISNSKAGTTKIQCIY